MLHSYAVTNNQSFLDRVEVDFTIGKKIGKTNWMADTDTGHRISKLMAIIGPNGSGKTALAKPIAFLGWFIRDSFQTKFDRKIPVTPHFAAPDKPTEFECVFDFEGKLWRYELKCNADRVLYESLYQKKDRFNYVFIRDWKPEKNAYSVKQQDFGLSPKIARNVRQNVSLISWAAQYDVPLAVKLSAIYVMTNVYVMGRIPMNSRMIEYAAEHFNKHEEHHDLMNKLLASWDLGLSGVELKEVQLPDEVTDTPKNILLPMGVHKSKGQEYRLPFAFESSGTQGAFVLLHHLLAALEVGGIAVIDEFENDLHPHMIEPILNLFADAATNPYNAQLIFTCHAIEVLNIVEKCQVMLVEKDDDCESAAIRMDKIEGIRNDDNYFAKYNAGTYGAIPKI